MMSKDSKIYVAGHLGLAGSAIVRCLEASGFRNILRRAHRELDLTRQQSTFDFFLKEKPEYVFMAAGTVGGIHVNSTCPAEFIYENLTMESNVIDSAYRAGAKKLLFLGSSCIYPKLAPQPIQEEYLLTSVLEKTNEPYAVAKIAGIKMCEAYNRQYKTDFLCVMPTNLYGPNDNFELTSSHVLPALIKKIHEAKTKDENEAVIWGSGNPRREFLFSEDLAEACLFLMEKYSAEDTGEIINIGTGEDLTIRELASLIAKVVGYKGQFVFDPSKPDGTPRKLLDISRIRKLGWKPKTSLEEGLRKTYEWFLKNAAQTS